METLFPTQRPRSTPVGYVRVALEQSVDVPGGGLTYAVNGALADLAVGDRVLAPLGRGDRLAPGVVIERLAEPDVDAAKLKFIAKRQQPAIRLPVTLLTLARWMASYYCCPLGVVLSTMIPAAVKHGTGQAARRYVRLLDEAQGPSAVEAEPDGAGAAAVEADASADEADASSAPARDVQGMKAVKPVKLSRLQKAAVEAAKVAHASGEGWIELKTLADLAGARSVAPVNQLIAKGVLAVTVQTDLREPSRPWARVDEAAVSPRIADEALTDEQARVIADISAAGADGFGVHLIHGVTGSGKTEVYLRLIEALRTAHAEQAGHAEQGASKANAAVDVDVDADEGAGASGAGDEASMPGVIVLVPEIALTPQTMARFVARFGESRVAVLHSGLTQAQRHAQWRRIRNGEASIVVGARSAVFAPLSKLGLVIVDEEHESSYKQDQAPRYHARDVAIRRAQLEGVPIVLGSATPSLESYFNAADVQVPAGSAGEVEEGGQVGSAGGGGRAGRLAKAHGRLHRLTRRVAGLSLPKVRIVDLAEDRRQRYRQLGDSSMAMLSLPLQHALERTIRSGGQAILLLNRRGYANFIACPDHNCGWVHMCHYCDALMVYHRDQRLPTGGVVRCHHCGAEQLLAQRCPGCSKRITAFGMGTQRVEEQIGRSFPDVHLLRMDSDTMRTGGDYHDSLETFRRGEAQVLLGTQMIAKGLDFPNVRLVGLISADTSLYLPDFRAAERTFQLIAQVAGRAGRSEGDSEVIVQTYNPDDPTIQLAAAHDYETFARRELNLRAQVGLPPVGRMVRIVVRDRDLAVATEKAQRLTASLQEVNEALGLGIAVRGPAACPIARIAEHFRQQIELLAGPPRAAHRLQQLLVGARNRFNLHADGQTAIDVDPTALL